MKKPTSLQTIIRRACAALAVTAVVQWAGVLPASAQTPTVLTDKVYQGSGTIDLLKDVSGSALSQFIQPDGRLLLGVDLNESVAGNETSTSVGVAIQSLVLTIVTTQGTFTFSDFYTNTTAMIRAAGSTVASEYQTLFGHAGSSAINGSTASVDKMDDVIAVNGVSYSGEVLSASVSLQFLNTAKTKGDTNESFFDYSGGPEDFALLSAYAAQTIENASAGVTTVSDTVVFTTDTTATATYVPPPTSGAPAPPIPVLLGLAALVMWRITRD